MKKEDAIERCKCIVMDKNFWSVENQTALNMAIEALEQEPCDDAISREAVIDALTKTSGIRGDALKALYDLPPVNPQEKTGRWIFKQFDEETGISNNYWCSKCDKPSAQVYKTYCANCGARMESET